MRVFYKDGKYNIIIKVNGVLDNEGDITEVTEIEAVIEKNIKCKDHKFRRISAFPIDKHATFIRVRIYDGVVRINAGAGLMDSGNIVVRYTIEDLLEALFEYGWLKKELQALRQAIKQNEELRKLYKKIIESIQEIEEIETNHPEIDLVGDRVKILAEILKMEEGE